MAQSCKTYRFWTREELDKLEGLVGQVPFPQACKRWNCWAATQGIPSRTSQSLRKQAQKQGWTALPWGEMVLVGVAAQLLGKHRSTLQEWISNGWVTRYGRGRASSLSRMELRRLAREKPQLFGGVPRPELVQLLEVEELVDWVLEQAPRRWQSSRNGHRIRWVNRGQVFDSYAAAGRAAHVCSKAIRQAIIEGRDVCGYRFERVA
jgi:hypothetical protein